MASVHGKSGEGKGCLFIYKQAHRQKQEITADRMTTQEGHKTQQSEAI